MVVRESDRLSRLLSDFLDYSRVGLERVEPLDLAQVARDCLALMEQHPESHARRGALPPPGPRETASGSPPTPTSSTGPSSTSS
jgi:signal transduction histidine kinase